MTGRLAGRRAVVTGAAHGIGRALALGLAGEGAAIACLDIDGSGAEATATALADQGYTAVGIPCDVTDFEAVEASLETVASVLGGADVLIANAGGSRGDATPFLELDPRRWQTMIDRNLNGAFYSGLVYGRHMAAAGWGTIVVVSSQLSEVVRPGLAHYSAAKGGVRQLVRAMAVDLAPHRIRVNAVAPGPTLTEGSQDWFSRPDVNAEHRRIVPLGRVAQPEEMVGAAVYLAGDESSFTTGATVFVDGGYTLI